MRIETYCIKCKKPIIKYSRKKKIKNFFCSLECKNIFKHEESFQIVKCSFCSKMFEKKKSEIKRIKKPFCSKECASKSLSSEDFYISVFCSNCGKTFKKYKKNKLLRKSKNDFCSTKCYFEFKRQRETDKLKIYYYDVGRETYKWEKEKVKKSNMVCYYTKQKLLSNEEFKKLFPQKHINSNDLQPTIDHKISIIYGFKHSISPKIIGGKNNLCVCARYVNRTKGILNEKDFKIYH